jgi:hypothetical protein
MIGYEGRPTIEQGANRSVVSKSWTNEPGFSVKTTGRFEVEDFRYTDTKICQRCRLDEDLRLSFRAFLITE